MISFLNPWFWLGALAVAAPIWLHLRRKRETNLVKFSALRFLDDLPVPRQSPRRLHDLLLFLLRVLALLLVIAAFAWPYKRDAVASPVKESRVYVLDNTLSHQANDGFTRGRGQILSELERLGSETQIAVIELTSRPNVVVSFADDRATAKRKLQDLQPSHQRGSYLAAFREAQTLLSNSLGDRRRIIFYGDNQENQWGEHLNAPPFLENLEIQSSPNRASKSPNLSLAEPRLQRTFLGEKSLVNFAVKLYHIGDAPRCNVALRVNGKVIFDDSIDLDKQPETMLLQAQWEADPSQWQQGEVTVQGAPDVLTPDNRVFFSLPPLAEGRVALLAQSTYLRLALSPEVMRGHWSTRALDPSQLSGELSAGADEDVLCLESHYLQSAEARKLVWRYLTNGRGVILFVNRVTPVIAGALRELGIEPQPGLKEGKTASQSFKYFFSNHPIFHPFLSPDYGNLMEVKVFNYYPLKAMQGLPLIFSEAGDPIFFEGTKFPGKLFVSAFGCDREQTSWSTHVTFIPFIDLCLQNARREDTTPIEYEPGQVGLVNLPASTGVRELALHDGASELQRVPVKPGGTQLLLPDKPGLYTVTTGESTEPLRIFSVNPSPKESQLKYDQTPAALDVWRLNSEQKAAKLRPATKQTELALTAIRQQQLWWWLLLAGLATLVLETAWSSMSRKYARE
jgi:hypothetical protein